MIHKIIDCKRIQENSFKDLKQEIGNNSFTIACLYLETDNPSISYLKQIKKQADYLNIKIKEEVFEENIGENEIIQKIHLLNKDTSIHGILFLNPNKANLDYENINKKIIDRKNIDTIEMPNTVYAVLDILKFIEKVKDKLIVVIGRGKLVGMPLYNYLKRNDYQVIQCHSKTENIQSITLNADILISAVGKPHFLKKEDIKEEAIVIDVGTAYKNNKIYGDVDLENVLDKVKLITKTPGGIGLLTTYYLFKNLVNKNKIK